jgi:hypothetical protein
MDHLFLMVWCEADGPFDIEKLHPKLKEIIEEIYYDPKITKDHLYGPIQEIYNLFLSIKKGRRRALKKWYVNNNDIKQLCAGAADCKPLHYALLKKINKDISPKIEKFFKSLFTDIIKLKPVWSRIGKIDDHYKHFIAVNDEGKCPFCGLHDLKNQYHERREAYDHYLPKDIYPFNAINFHNLSPMCHECNSSYKTVKDPLYNSGKRRKAYYPYADEIDPPELTIDLKETDIDALEPSDIDIDVSLAAHQEEVDTWLDVFGIEERYKATCLARQYGKSWVAQAVDEYDIAKASLPGGFTRQDWQKYLIVAAKSSPFTDGNFIKAAFLEGCQQAGIL